MGEWNYAKDQEDKNRQKCWLQVGVLNLLCGVVRGLLSEQPKLYSNRKNVHITVPQKSVINFARGNHTFVEMLITEHLNET